MNAPRLAALHIGEEKSSALRCCAVQGVQGVYHTGTKISERVWHEGPLLRALIIPTAL